MIQKVGIIGLGAIGILYAVKMTEKLGKDNVFIIADQNRIEKYRNEGIYANGKRCDFNYVVDKEAPAVDLLLFATKFYGLEAAIESARKACSPDTIVMACINGVTAEEVVKEKLNPNHLLYCTIQGMDATKEGNQMFFENVGSITFGEKDNTVSDSVKLVKAFLDDIGIPSLIPENILKQLWSKWMLNVGVNQTCAVYGVGYGGVQKNGPYRKIFVDAMEEARSIAKAEGIILSEEEMMAWADLMDRLSPIGEPSMRQDKKAGRQTEVELFSGLVCKLGKKYGIQTPINEMYYNLLNE